MESLYRRPIRVYLVIGALALWGIMSGLQLSVSLFPMATRATIFANVGYGAQSADYFYQTVGRNIESSLQEIKVDNISASLLQAEYTDTGAQYKLIFGWGADPEEAKKAVESRIQAFITYLDPSVRDSLSVGSYRENQGFFALSFYSPLRSLDELHQILTPHVAPLHGKIQDAASVSLFNPAGKEITIELNPEKMAQLGILPSQVDQMIKAASMEFDGGGLRLGDSAYQLTLPKIARSVSELESIRVSDPSSPPVLLKDIGKLSVNVSPESKNRFKTSGVDSLILFASPKDNGNLKRMSDEIVSELNRIRAQLPDDINAEIIVNPADYINKSIAGVFKEVGLATLLAVTVLFIFIGSFRNVATAAIEIPISLLMAFILMKLTGMNLNLISLGGLALSAGMNVDASVVVLENIFRHFEGQPRNLNFQDKTKIVSRAVNEVKMPIIASTIASLVVFLPLIFTNGLASSLLGDLAKAVIFSHGLSAIVALVLVPTIRLQLLKNGEIKQSHSPFEKYLKALENAYRGFLESFLQKPKIQILSLAAVVACLISLIFLVAPNLKQEVIGKPDSDWLIVGMSAPLLDHPREIEAELDTLHEELMKHFGNDTLYTFSQSWERGGNIMLRLRDKNKIQELSKKATELYPSRHDKSYWVTAWNPSELQIPTPPDLKIDVIGGTSERRLEVAQDLHQKILEETAFSQVQANFPATSERGITVTPISNLGSQPDVLQRYDLSFFLKTALDGSRVDTFADPSGDFPIYLRFPESSTSSLEGLKSLPIGFEGRLIPIGALARFQIETKKPVIFRENQQALYRLQASATEEKKKNLQQHLKEAREVVVKMQNRLIERQAATSLGSEHSKIETKGEWPIVSIAGADPEVQSAFDQLKWAIAVSVALIFITMILQTGDFLSSLIILVSIPFGLIGVISSLAIFGSTLSLNSGLGTILLNGIAVANSIILVDFIRRLAKSGMDPLKATVEASTARMRPILMTTLTTVLGMLPIAMGFGDGGKTLQPLGITVSGGLWVSTIFTLIFVPMLQLRYMRWKETKLNLKKQSPA